MAADILSLPPDQMYAAFPYVRLTEPTNSYDRHWPASFNLLTYHCFFNEHFFNERRLQNKTKGGGREKTHKSRALTDRRPTICGPGLRLENDVVRRKIGERPMYSLTQKYGYGEPPCIQWALLLWRSTMSPTTPNVHQWRQSEPLYRRGLSHAVDPDPNCRSFMNDEINGQVINAVTWIVWAAAAHGTSEANFCQ